MRELSEALDFNNHFILHILLNSITSTDFLKRIAPVVPNSIFKTREKKFLYKIITDYYSEFKKAPQDHFYDLFEERSEEISEELNKRCVDVVRSLKNINHSNPEYILSRIHKAIKHFELEEALVAAANLVKVKKHEEAKAVILKAFRKPEQIKETYYDFFSDTNYIESRIQGKGYKMKTLIKPVDEMVGGFNPSQLITILGAAKFGKTWFLIEMAVAALIQGLNVLFVSLEMSKYQIDIRFDQAIGFLGTRPDEIVEVMNYKKGEWTKIKATIDTVYDLEIVEKSRKALAKMGGKLEISDQTGARMNYSNLDNLILEIEETKGIIFDVIIIDYLGEMGPTLKEQKKKERISENCSGLKNIAKERNVIVITAQQGNRQAFRSKVFHSDLIADAIEPVFVSDTIFSINQTAKEEEHNIFRLYLANARHDTQHSFVPLIRDLSRGQIALDKGKIIFEEEENETKKNEIGFDY